MKIIRHVNRAARYALFAVVVGSALALSVIRFWLLPEVSRFRSELAARAGNMIGESVRIGAISARMQGLEPQLVLHDFTIIDAQLGTPALSFQRVRLGVSLLRSVLQGAPAIVSLGLEGARVGIIRRRNGTLAIRGMNPNTGPPIWLLSVPSLMLRSVDLEWQDLQAGTPAVPLGRLDLRGRSAGAEHRLSATAALAGGLGGTLKLAADLQGEGVDPADWSGRLYLDGRRFRPAALTEWLPFPAKIKDGLAEVRMWGDWKRGQIEAAMGSVTLEKPILAYRTSADTDTQLALNEFSGRFDWRQAGDGWSLAVNGLRWVLPGESWPETDLNIDVVGDVAATTGVLRAAVSYFRLEHLRMLLGWLPAGEVREALHGLAPRGAMRNARFVYGQASSSGWGVCAEFEDVAINPWAKVPGMDHLDGRLCGNERGGRAGFELRGPTLASDSLWLRPISVDSLNGELQWSQDTENWRVAIPTAEFEGPGLHAALTGAVEIPKAPDKSPFLDVRARFTDVDAKTLHDYLPLAAMSKNSSAWLSGAFQGGSIKSADLLLFGSIGDFPYRAGEGVFQALAEVENLNLAYDPEWPHLTDLGGSVRFDGAGMSIDARSGMIGGAPIRDTHAQTLDFDKDPWLSVTGKVAASVPQSMTFLAHTPLRHIPERLQGVADPQGDTDIDLKLKIPLISGLGDVQVDGVARLKNASLDFPALGVGLGQINGDLYFTEAILRASGMRAVAFGNPVSVDLERGAKAIQMDLRGAVSIADLREEIPGEFWHYAGGSFNYRLSAEIPGAKSASNDPLRVVLASDLSGLDVQLPAPLGKPKAAKRDARVELAVRGGSKVPVHVDYGDVARAQLWLAEPSSGFALLGGDISLGDGTSVDSGDSGLRLRANVSDLDASAWSRFLFGEDKASLTANGLFRSVLLDTRRLWWQGMDMGPLKLDAQSSGRGWKGALEGQFGKGHYSIQIPEFGHPSIRLDMDRLNIPPGDTDKPKPPLGEELKPMSVPVIQVNARQTYWRGADLGALELVTERWTQGLNIKKLTLQHPNHDLQLKGTWLQAEGRDETRIDGKLNIADMGRFLASLGYAKEIRDTVTDAQFSLSWPGAPHQLAAATVAGDIHLNLGRGSVLKMEPGLGRALAVLNLDSLRRLLLLDFSDIFGKGLAYDSMRGHFELGGGQARTSGFLIDAVAAVIAISGRVGLVQRDLDETVTVIPHTFASLPMAGAMVGGAAVGAAISMAGRLIGQDSVSIASNHYAIRGSWDNPQVSRIEGNMPLDVLDRAWSGLKNLSGFGSSGVEDSNE